MKETIVESLHTTYRCEDSADNLQIKIGGTSWRVVLKY